MSVLIYLDMLDV